MEIIPAIDIINGQCVRLEKGDYARKKLYHEDPISVAKSFEEAGIKRLHLVDLDGAKSKIVVNLSILKEITEQTSLQVDFGGGVKTRADLVKVFDHGAKQVTGGSIAATDQSQFLSWLSEFGPDQIILGADTLNDQIMVSGWQKASAIGLEEFLDFYVGKGIKYDNTLLLVDGKVEGIIREMIYHRFVCVPRGDATYASIAAASILAKSAQHDYINQMCDGHPELDT